MTLKTERTRVRRIPERGHYDKEIIITAGCGVRLKIKGRTVEQGNITAIGTIKDNYLGLIDDGSGEAGDDM